MLKDSNWSIGAGFGLVTLLVVCVGCGEKVRVEAEHEVESRPGESRSAAPSPKDDEGKAKSVAEANSELEGRDVVPSSSDPVPAPGTLESTLPTITISEAVLKKIIPKSLNPGMGISIGRELGLTVREENHANEMVVPLSS